MIVTVNCPIRARSYGRNVSGTTRLSNARLVHVDQPGYDALAELYASTFPSPYLTPIEEHAVAAFADTVRDSGLDGVVVDVGCGLGQVTADLARRLTVVGLDPSEGMFAFAKRDHPALDFVIGDSSLGSIDADVPIVAIIARFSLIHSDPSAVPDILRTWAGRVPVGGTVLVACQMSEDAGVVEFDHKVAPAWRWHPDRLSAELSAAGFGEVWRITARPDADHRFPDVHMLARRH